MSSPQSFLLMMMRVRGMTRADLAARANIDLRTLRRALRGLPVRPSVAADLARALGVPWHRMATMIRTTGAS